MEVTFTDFARFQLNNVLDYVAENETLIVIAVMHTKQSPRTVTAVIRSFLNKHTD